MPSTVPTGTASATGKVTNGEQLEDQLGPLVAVKANRQKAIANANGSHPYTFIVYTSKKHTGITDGDVIVIVYGSKNRTGVGFVLKKESAQGIAFLEGQKDYFSVQSKHLGNISKVKIKPATKGAFKDWFLRKIIISDEATNTEYCFVCRKKIFTGNSTSYKMTVDGYGAPTDSEKEHHNRTKKLHFKPKAQIIPIPVKCDPLKPTIKNEEGSGTDLSVAEIDAMVEKNTLQHHTTKYRLESKPTSLLLRRGESFLLTVILNKEAKFRNSGAYFEAVMSSHLNSNEDTETNIYECPSDALSDLKSSGKWGYCVRTSNGREILVEIFIPVSTVPNRYRIALRDKHHTLCELDAPVYILYNPWCEEDEVYMADEIMRSEYVMKQNGLLFIGGANKPRSRHWYFGQFEEVSMDAAFILLEQIEPTKQDSVAEISRRLIAMINNNGENNGVLSANWSGNYEGGRPPSYWNSSTAILEIYLTTGQSVKWGQCWVYSAVVTTVMRTLGIPCRCVTNYYSAHNKDAKCTFDIYLDENGEKIADMTNEDIWNFHAWNDVWIIRKDLPSEYSGWQVVDATPQERCQGLVQMGPASLRAIKEGDINLPYDTKYILAAVNADKLYKQQNSFGQWQVTGFDQKSVGMRISTKAIRMTTRQDITNEYKYENNAVLEREEVRQKMVMVQNHEFRDCEEDIKVELHPEEPDVEVGDDVSLYVRVVNSSHHSRTVQLLLCGSIVRYNGVPKAHLQKYSESILAAPRDCTETTFTVHASQYLSYLEDETMIKFVATSSVNETGQIVCAEELINIAKPSLKITGLPEQLLAGVTQEFVISLTNPLEAELTDCEIYIDGSIIPTRIYVKGIRDVPIGGKLVEPVRLTPHIPLAPHNKAVRSTKKSMTVSFTCKELGGLNQTLKVFVINIK